MTLTDSFLTAQRGGEHLWQIRLVEGGCFVLAEAALNDAVPWLAERWGGGLEQSRLYWGDTGREHASISPYCFPVDTENWPQVREHLVREDGWGTGIQLEWFMRTLSMREQLQALVIHLRQWSRIVTPEGETAILRIGDWQIVNTLLSASTLAEATGLFGPVSSFCQIEPTGDIQMITLNQREPGDQPAILPRELSDAQWRMLLAPAEMKVFAGYMEHLRMYHGRWRDSDEDVLLAFVRQQSSQAKQHGFTHDRDIVRYLALATELEPDFINSPWAKLVLQEPEFIGEQSRMDRLYRRAIEYSTGE